MKLPDDDDDEYVGERTLGSVGGLQRPKITKQRRNNDPGTTLLLLDILLISTWDGGTN